MIPAHLLDHERYISFKPVRMEMDGGGERQRRTEALLSNAHRSHRTTPVTKATSVGVQAGKNQTLILKLRLSERSTQVMHIGSTNFNVDERYEVLNLKLVQFQTREF